MTGYSKAPLIKKLGMKEARRGIFLSAPKEVLALFKQAPFNRATRLSGNFDYIHFFATSEKTLQVAFPKLKKCLKPAGLLWISWPKSSKLGTDLNENKVRAIGLASGLVDVKVAAINATWSGLKFVYRIKDR